MDPASPRNPPPGSPAMAAGALAGKVAELPSLEVETRQLWVSGPTGGSEVPGDAAEAAWADGLGTGKRCWAFCTLCSPLIVRFVVHGFHIVASSILLQVRRVSIPHGAGQNKPRTAAQPVLRIGQGQVLP